MAKPSKTQGEQKFADIQKKLMQGLKEQEKERQESAERTARLRERRLAKEAIDKAGKA